MALETTHFHVWNGRDFSSQSASPTAQRKAPHYISQRAPGGSQERDREGEGATSGLAAGGAGRAPCVYFRPPECASVRARSPAALRAEPQPGSARRAGSQPLGRGASGPHERAVRRTRRPREPPGAEGPSHGLAHGVSRAPRLLPVSPAAFLCCRGAGRQEQGGRWARAAGGT